jgi:ATP-dependent 26S proteasome regulatory subunit
MFRDTDFTCKDGEFVEVSDVTGDQMKPAEVVKKTVAKEKLVFDEGATIVDVMRDIVTFFKKDTEELYAKMDIAYKRGIILYGDPGNGKSAMIREIIRQIPKITKVVINPNVSNMPRILASLLQALKGKQAIIIIEDLDSLVTSRNRSEFLNLLDGVDISSGIYLIGTTNYPDRVDPAIMNRSGRFDRTYKIENPSEATRRAFFESRKVDELLEEYDVWKDENKGNKPKDIIELFVKNSHDLPMASLKEVMTGTKYLLATSQEDLSVEEAVETTYQVLTKNKQEHTEAHEARLNRRRNDEYEYGEF